MAKDKNRSASIQCILVAVDHSNSSDAALETAAMLAKITKAQIHGLYVQEEHWEHLNKMPSATYINALTGRAELFDENRLERQVKMIARRLQRKLKALGHEHDINHRWKSIKGQVIEEILKAGKEVDLVTIGRRSSSMLQKKKLGSTAKAVIQRSEIPVMVLGEYSFVGRSIIVVYDATTTSQKGLHLGLSIANKNRSRLSVLALKNSSTKGRNRDKVLENMVDSANIPVNIIALKQSTIGSFVQIVKRQRPGLVIIPKKQPLLKVNSPDILLQYLKCSVLFMA